MAFRTILLATFALAYDYNLLVLQWKPTECMKKNSKCEPDFLTNDFNIHGLWPEYNNGSWPQNCHEVNNWPETDVRSEFKVTDQLAKKMKKNWNSYKPDPTGFWKHEWYKHGTCFEPNTGSIDYFNLVLEQFEKYDVKEALEKIGLVVGAGGGYKKTEFQGAFTFKVGLKCRKFKGTVYLDSVVICLDKELKAMDCLHQYDGPCDEAIYYPFTLPHREDL